MGLRQPGIGEPVHYLSFGTPGGEYTSECRAAIVTAVKDPAGQAGGGIVDLCVLSPTGLFFNQDASHVLAEHQVGGSWHWPDHQSPGDYEAIDEPRRELRAAQTYAERNTATTPTAFNTEARTIAETQAARDGN